MYQEERDWADSLTLSWEYEPIAPSVIQAIEEAGYFCEAHFDALHNISYYKCYFVPVPEKQRDKWKYAVFCDFRRFKLLMKNPSKKGFKS
ncbi:hypothetical protein [Enterococcus gallinarum]|uniref:hypothetical protein n=1 Tax=Enterococcus gallinarum TaxID=1353 RepID=UPI00214AE261|nr:hypothetical protein [Enterococcus gallinarum]MCR1932326.1 hypothetical protein [Enterococcus gallinarum]